MRKWLFTVMLLAAVAMTSGCWETNQVIRLNVDGSGSIDFEMVTALPVNPMGGDSEIADPQAAASKGVQKILKDCKGIDAWEKVSFRVLQNGRIYVTGRAYFPDVTKVKMPWGELDAQWTKPDADGNRMLKLGVELSPNRSSRPSPTSKDEKDFTKLSKEEQKKRILIERMKYQSSRPLLAAMLTTMKIETTWILPGTITDTGALQRSARDGGVRMVFNGKEVLAAIDKLVLDDTLIRDMLKASADTPLRTEAGEKMFAKIVFGKDALMQVKLKGPYKDAFDYKKAMEAAKKAEPAMRKKLGWEDKKDGSSEDEE